MTTENNGVYPTPEIAQMVASLMAWSDIVRLAGPPSAPVEESEEEEPVECTHCGSEIDIEYDGFFSGTIMIGNARFNGRNRYLEGQFCDDCYSYCEDCDEAILRDDNNSLVVYGQWGDYSRILCAYCMDNYRSCDRCDSTFHHDDLNWIDPDDSDDWGESQLCNDCQNAIEREACKIHDYSWQPCDRNFWYVNKGSVADAPNRITFKGATAIPNLDGWHGWTAPVKEIEENKNQLFMGFELETNNRKCPDLREAAEYLLKSVSGDGSLDGEQYLYLKRDGSISGFEIVSMPATLEAHKVLLPREAIKNLAHEHGLAGWRNVNGTGAGFHIHVSKQSFRSHSHLQKFQMLHYRNAEWLKRFAGRDSGRWASFERTSSSYGDGYKLSDFSKGSYRSERLNRYHALNFIPSHTVELRYFRSTLNPESVLATLELVHAMWRYSLLNRSRDIHENNFTWGAFRGWASEQSEYEFLIPTMVQRTV